MTRALIDGGEHAPSLRRMAARLGEPAIRTGVGIAMKIMGEQFVLGRDIGEALRRARGGDNAPFRYSFDMLGEAARTQADRSEEHTSELQSLMRISYAVFCLKKKSTCKRT